MIIMICSGNIKKKDDSRQVDKTFGNWKNNNIKFIKCCESIECPVTPYLNTFLLVFLMLMLMLTFLMLMLMLCLKSIRFALLFTLSIWGRQS